MEGFAVTGENQQIITGMSGVFMIQMTCVEAVEIQERTRQEKVYG